MSGPAYGGGAHDPQGRCLTAPPTPPPPLPSRVLTEVAGNLSIWDWNSWGRGSVGRQKKKAGEEVRAREFPLPPSPAGIPRRLRLGAGKGVGVAAQSPRPRGKHFPLREHTGLCGLTFATCSCQDGAETPLRCVCLLFFTFCLFLHLPYPNPGFMLPGRGHLGGWAGCWM